MSDINLMRFTQQQEAQIVRYRKAINSLAPKEPKGSDDTEQSLNNILLFQYALISCIYDLAGFLAGGDVKSIQTEPIEEGYL